MNDLLLGAATLSRGCLLAGCNAGFTPAHANKARVGVFFPGDSSGAHRPIGNSSDAASNGPTASVYVMQMLVIHPSQEPKAMTQEPKRPVTHQLTKRRTRGTALAQMLALAAEHQGLTNATMAAALGVAPTNVSARIADACRRGHLFRAERGGYELHWFDTAERAQAWAALPPLHKPELTAPVPNRHTTIVTKKKGPAALTRFTAGASKLVSIAPDAPVNTDGVPYRYDPAPLGRFEVPAPESFRGEFATGGRYVPGIDPMTGQAWGARA